MMEAEKNIVKLDSLEIGFITGKKKKSLLPPLKAEAGKGELIAVIGRNGIGKSTLLRTIAGLQPSIDGRIILGGREIKSFSRQELAEKVGFVSTEIIRVSNMTVYDLVSIGRFPHTNWFGKIDARNHDAVTDSISKAGLSGLKDVPVTQLSDGERQKAMIAMVLAQDADLMILDEPTAFLDIRSKFEIMHLLHDLARNRGKTIIFSTHDFNGAISQADKLWMILHDRFIEGSPEDIILSGSVNSLFDQTIVKFNSHDGNFMMHNEVKGKISVIGEGDIKYWTKKAVIRSGYSVSDSHSSARIEVPGDLNQCWKLTSDRYSARFSSLYELAGFLRNNREFIS